MPATYEPVATQSVSGVSSISFTSIPATYTDLKLVFVGYNDAPLMKIEFNGDSSNGGVTMMIGNGSSAASARYGTQWLYVWTPNANSYFTLAVNIFNYANTNTYKSWLGRCDIAHGAGGPTAAGGTWRSTSAINRVDISTSSLTMSGTFTIYGIKAA
jgi:hypothetical protein